MPARESKYKIRLQYQGTRYQGWQIQRNGLTVQGMLTEVLSRMAGKKVTVTGAGRTDAGVHALGQVAHFCFPEKESVPDLRRALNANLPWDIRVISLQRVRLAFDAQRDARGKQYEYRIFNGPVIPPFLYHLRTHIPLPLDTERMDRAARDVLGRHDFSAFAAAASTVRSKVREVTLSRVRRQGLHVAYRIEAGGFLHHMVRNIAGTLIEIGLGRRSERDIERVLGSLDRKQAGPTAPPQGLFLVRVWY